MRRAERWRGAAACQQRVDGENREGGGVTCGEGGGCGSESLGHLWVQRTNFLFCVMGLMANMGVPLSVVSEGLPFLGSGLGGIPVGHHSSRLMQPQLNFAFLFSWFDVFHCLVSSLAWLVVAVQPVCTCAVVAGTGAVQCSHNS